MSSSTQLRLVGESLLLALDAIEALLASQYHRGSGAPGGLPQSTMNKIRSDLRVILIGGSSHVGKSTLSRSLADRLGWRLISTDNMARHPGRPWRSASDRVPDHVAEHYLTRSVGELITDVLHHYQANVGPNVETLIRSATTEASSDRMILEGSALWLARDTVAGLGSNTQLRWPRCLVAHGQ